MKTRALAAEQLLDTLEDAGYAGVDADMIGQWIERAS